MGEKGIPVIVASDGRVTIPASVVSEMGWSKEDPVLIVPDHQRGRIIIGRAKFGGKS